jgi:hypothetical protein
MPRKQAASKRKRKPRARPPALAELQAWFGKAIARPLPDKYLGNPLAVSAPELGRQAQARLWTRGAMSGFARLGVYNQQYWFRLITIMQEEYSCTAHLLGLRRFNDWVVRYLEAHPPASPFLTYLDAKFPAFMSARYRGKDRAQVTQAAAYERAFSKAVDAPEARPLGSATQAQLLSLPLCLAPHATPLRLDWDFFSFRALCLADASLEEKIALSAAEPDYVMIYRDAEHTLRQASISEAAYRLLQAMREPASVPEIFARLENLPAKEALDAEGQTELAANLSAWFRDWVAQGWIGRGDPEADAGRSEAEAAASEGDADSAAVP